MAKKRTSTPVGVLRIVVVDAVGDHALEEARLRFFLDYLGEMVRKFAGEFHLSFTIEDADEFDLPISLTPMATAYLDSLEKTP
jgi:hypothetical protein